MEKELDRFADKIIRWSGFALGIGGAIAALFWTLHPEQSMLVRAERAL